MEFKGTKGKWENHGNEFIRCDYIGSSFKICTVVKDMPYPANKEMGMANAKLIAAAPDLLEALMSIENDQGNIPKTIWDMRNKAIKKALK